MSAKAPSLILPNENTLLDIGVLRAQQLPEQCVTPHVDLTLLVLGTSGSGKTKLTIKILDLENEELLPTLLLGYLCATKDTAIEGEGSRTCHAWELAGIGMDSVLDVMGDAPELRVLLVLDLSTPQFLYQTLNSCLNSVLEFLGKRTDLKELRRRRKEALPQQYPDLAEVNPFPIPLAIVGGKYDLFQCFEPEKKKAVTKVLRYVAHINCANLVFTGDGHRLSSPANQLLHHFAFGTHTYEGPIKDDYNSPVIITPGKDSLSKIDATIGESHSLSKYLHLLEMHFPQKDPVNFHVPNDPTTNENFKEPSIDALRKQKDEMLIVDRKEKARKQKLIEDLGLEEDEDTLSATEESLKWNLNL